MSSFVISCQCHRLPLHIECQKWLLLETAFINNCAWLNVLILSQFLNLYAVPYFIWSSQENKSNVITVITVGWKQFVYMCLFLSLSRPCVRVVHSGTKNKFTMPVVLSFWGKEEDKAAVIERMARRGYKLNTSVSGLTGTDRLNQPIVFVYW